MKKLGVLVMALIFILSASVYSFADERVNFSGEFKTAAWMEENKNGNEDNDQYFWEQRFRMATNINISEAVSTHLRFDYTEGVWGENFERGGWVNPLTNVPDYASPNPNKNTNDESQLQIDRAYAQIAQEMFTLKAGLHWNGVGNYILWDQQTTGFTLDLNLPVHITLNYSKVSEGGNPDNSNSFDLTDSNDDFCCDTEDTDFYGINAGYGTEVWDINALFAMLKDYRDNDDSPYAFGVYGSIALDLLTINAEIDILGGQMNDNVDYYGTQGLVDAAYDIHDMFNIGMAFYYAEGKDDNDKRQKTNINNGSWTFNPFGFGGELFDDHYPEASIGMFNFSNIVNVGPNAGVVGARLYSDMTLTDKISAYLRVGYLQPEEDYGTNADAFIASGNIDYQWLENVYLSGGLSVTDPSVDGVDTETRFTGLGQIAVKF